MTIPGDSRVRNTAALLNMSAPIGTVVQVDSELRRYVAVPTSGAAADTIPGPSDLAPISWQPIEPIERSVDGFALTADPASAVLTSVINWLLPSMTYHATIVASATLWETADTTKLGSLEIVQDVHIVTSSSAVATVTLKEANTAVKRLPTGLDGSVIAVVAATGGLSVAITRASGLNTTGNAKWSCQRFTLVG